MPISRSGESQTLAKDILAAPNQQLRAKGDLHRTCNFPAASKAMPYRLYVPTTWDGQSKLPLIVMLHGAGSDENRYMDSNNKQLERLAEQHGYIVVSPLGYSPMSAYGTPLRLPAVFGQTETAAKQRAGVTPDAEHTLELSEKDVINVLEIVLNEYPINRSSVLATREGLEKFRAKIGTLVSRATALMEKGVSKDQLMARLDTTDLGWRFDFTGDRLAHFYADLSKAK